MGSKKNTKPRTQEGKVEKGGVCDPPTTPKPKFKPPGQASKQAIRLDGREEALEEVFDLVWNLKNHYESTDADDRGEEDVKFGMIQAATEIQEAILILITRKETKEHEPRRRLSRSKRIEND